MVLVPASAQAATPALALIQTQAQASAVVPQSFRASVPSSLPPAQAATPAFPLVQTQSQASAVVPQSFRASVPSSLPPAQAATPAFPLVQTQAQASAVVPPSFRASVTSSCPNLHSNQHCEESNASLSHHGHRHHYSAYYHGRM